MRAISPDSDVSSPVSSRLRSLSVYRKTAYVALGALVAIVISGALVRLTGSGLGCSDWPRCNEQKLIDVSSGHTAIEQINRLFTGVVSGAVIATVLLAHRLKPRRRELLVWAWMLVAGVLAQIVLGGIVVLTGLHPLANMGHFLLSMFLVFAAVVLVRRIDRPGHLPLWRHVKDLPETVRPVNLHLFAVTAIATVVFGTIVTASGPHAGDEEAPRLGFDLSNVARLHTISMFLMIGTALWMMRRARRGVVGESRAHLQTSLSTLMAVVVVQGGIGYWQYLVGVPAFLVALHIAGATAFFISAVLVYLAPPAPQ